MKAAELMHPFSYTDKLMHKGSKGNVTAIGEGGGDGDVKSSHYL